MKVLFDNNFWNRFGITIRKSLFFESSFRYDFGLGSRDVREVCKWHLVPENRSYLRSEILIPNNLINELEDFNTVVRITKWVNSTYPSKKYYLKDERETWNTPIQTLNSFEDRKLGLVPKNTTDCDDYAILIYNLCRAAGISSDDLFLSFMATTSKGKDAWHMNVMFYHHSVPYAIEGTYFPDKASKFFGKTPYFNIEYYKYVKWIWNENNIYRYSDKINPLVKKR